MTSPPGVRKNWIESDAFLARSFVVPAQRFMHMESASGGILLIAAIVAMLWANLDVFGDSYDRFWHASVQVSIGPIHLDETLQHVVNDGLMAIFFFVVGLEIKREIVHGELRDPRKAALPALAALGGMVVPAVIFLAITQGAPGAGEGWGIPMATDIAFSLGVLALAGSRVPLGAKLFLLALAVVDDLGAIAVIAIFYTDTVKFGWLAVGAGALGLIAVATRVRIRTHMLYAPIALLTWFAFLESGVHATIAGVMIGLLTPARPLYDNDEFDTIARDILDSYPGDRPPTAAIADHEALLIAEVARESVSPLSRSVRVLHGWTSFFIIPAFALANAGVRLVGVDLGAALTSRVALGVAIGLVVGKTVGVTVFSYVAVRLGWGKLPDGMTWRHVLGVAMLAGVGFTVALFIAELAFADAALTSLAKIGIFAGSIIASILGFALLRNASRAPTTSPAVPDAHSRDPMDGPSEYAHQDAA